MDLSRSIAVSPSIVSRLVGEEVIILDLESGTYFGLDPIGARAWRLIEDGKSLAEVCTIMLGEYDVERETLERDLLELTTTLAKRKLISAV